MKPPLYADGRQRAPHPSLARVYLGAPEWTVVGRHLKERKFTQLRKPALGGGGVEVGGRPGGSAIRAHHSAAVHSSRRECWGL